MARAVSPASPRYRCRDRPSAGYWRAAKASTHYSPYSDTHLRVSDESVLYRAEAATSLIIEPLDAVTLMYHRRSGITHIVAEPTPQILAAMADDTLSVHDITQRLSRQFDLGDADEACGIIGDRLAELAELGLATRVAQ